VGYVALTFRSSGHGIQADGGDHTEADGKVEAICESRYRKAVGRHTYTALD
jgi:hypothetical protein